MKSKVGTLNEVVDAELDALPVDMLGLYQKISLLIEELGLERVREPLVKHLRGSLWEVRLQGEGRDCEGDLCNRQRQASGDGAGICQENSEDAGE